MSENIELEVPEFLAELPHGVNQALQAIDEHKGQSPVVLDMRVASEFTQFMIVCSGRSEKHVQALSDAIADHLRDQSIKPSHIEGRASGNWVLLDYGDMIVHVFTPESRDAYQLEKLWRVAPLLHWRGAGDDAA